MQGKQAAMQGNHASKWSSQGKASKTRPPGGNAMQGGKIKQASKASKQDHQASSKASKKTQRDIKPDNRVLPN